MKKEEIPCQSSRQEGQTAFPLQPLPPPPPEVKINQKTVTSEISEISETSEILTQTEFMLVSE